MHTQYAAAGLALALAVGSPAQAQHAIEWKQTVNTPKGLNMPKDVKAEILGIEVGDSYTEVKPKLERLLAEGAKQAAATVAPPPARAPGMPPPPPWAQPVNPPPSGDPNINALTGESSAGPVTEKIMQFRLDAPGGYITASYPGETTVLRKMKGSTPRDITDVLELRFTAPSSGHQLVSIKRTLLYDAPSDQPRVAELLASLKAKFKADPQRVTETKYRFQFDNGRAHVPAKVDYLSCRPVMAAMSSSMVPEINRSGDCDVVLEIDIGFGVSIEHAKRVDFMLSDNERIKLNAGADYAFFESYVRDLQNRTKGATPKL